MPRLMVDALRTAHPGMPAAPTNPTRPLAAAVAKSSEGEKLAALFVLGFVGVFAGGCVPAYPLCDSDQHCKDIEPDEWCVNNVCVACRNDRDCRFDQECRDGSCCDIPGFCGKDHACPMGQVCRDRRCSPCISDEECEPDMMCQNGTCLPRPGDCCFHMDQLPPGEMCGPNCDYYLIPPPWE